MQNRKILKGYELRERVGAGGFGEVFRAYQPAVQREVAIKVILPQYANEPDFIRRFDVEAQLVARLEHPHIVPLYDYWRDPEGAYLVMRWLPKSLQKTIDHTPWSIADAARLLDQVAMGLSVAHRDHIIHRDIKPENILLDEDNNAYLADFGIAKDLGIEITSSNPDDISGSPAYLSPEQIRGEKVSARSDIYSLGYVMYEVLIGEKAIRNATSLMHYLQHHLEHPLPILSPQYSHIPAAIDEVLQTATAKIPEQRYANVERFAAAFRAALPTKFPRMHGQPLATPLTERELEVLRLIIDGLGNSQISDRLYLSPTTIKWYIRQIYSKLEVHSRHQAIARAQALNLFQAVSPLTIPAPQNGNAKHEVLIDPVNPYKGLQAYQEADANDFFGRAILVEQLLNRLSEKREGRFLVVVGPSGSGKSSVIKAGLIPALRNGALTGSPRPFITEMFPGTHPLEELEAALLRVAVNPFPGLLEQLQQDRRGLVRAVKRVLPGDDETELILVIDQFEELFTLVADELMRVHFIDNLLSAATDPRSRIRIVLTLRADFYDRPLLYPRLAELVRSYTELVLPLSARELEQAMLGPAEQAGVQFEAGLIATILNDIGEQPGALPLLQYALTEVFERREGLTLTLDAYKAVGGVAGALARRADDLYVNLTEAEQAAVHQLFLRLVTPGEGTEDTRRRALQSELLSTGGNTGMMEEVIATFSQYRLLTLDRDPITRGPTVEVAHEALIRQWERLRDWLTHSREDIRLQRSLALSATDWERARYDVSYLLGGTRLAQIEEWSSIASLALAEAERTFLEASLAERKRQAVEEKERQERESRLKQRSVLFLHSLLGVFVASTIIAVSLMSIAFRESGRANTALAAEQDARILIEENVKELRELALVNGAQAAYVSNDLDTARASSLAANMGESPSSQSQLILADAAYAPGTVRVISDDDYDHDWGDATLSPDGHTLVTMSYFGNRELVIWDLVLGKVVGIFPVIPKDLTSVIAFRPTAADQDLQLLTASEDETMTLWDFESQQPLRTFTYQAPLWAWQAVFSPDGERIASVSEDNIVRIWDTDSGTLLHILENHVMPILGLSFSPDGSQLLSASQDGSVVLWETATGRLLEQFDTGLIPNDLVFSADAKRFLVTSWSPFIMNLWDIDTHSEVRTFKRVGPIDSPHFSQDGQTVFGSEGNYVTFWDINTGEVTRTLTGHTWGGTLFPMNADATQLLTVGRDGTIREWDLRHGAEIARTQNILPNHLMGSEISPDGQTFAVAAGGNTVRPDLPGLLLLYDAVTGAEIRRFGVDGVAHTQTTSSVRFSPDGRTILSADWSGEIKLWDATDGSLLWDIQGIALAADASEIKPDDSLAVNSIEFTPDGRALIASTDVGDVVWIDSATGKIIRRFPFGVPVRKAILTRDGTRFLACLADKSSSVVLVDVETGETLRHLLGQTQVCFALAVAPDDLTAASGHVDGSIFLWDLTTGQLIRPFTGGLGKITELIFSNDSQTVYSGGFAGPAQAPTVSFWNVATGELYRRMGVPNPTDALDLSTDGRTLLGGTYNGIAALWRIDDLPTLLDWTYDKRYVRELTCTERELYRLEPLCSNTNGSKTE